MTKPVAKAKRKPRKPTARKTGPAPFEPTQEQRERVEILMAGAMSEEEIAISIGLSRNSLRKHFAKELRGGRAKRRSEVLVAMFTSAKAGNVSAQKGFIALGAVAAAADEFDRKVSAPAARPRKLGKKEEAAEAALTAGENSEWGDDLKAPSAIH